MWSLRKHQAERERLLNCLARYLIANPEKGRQHWRNWADSNHRNYKGQAWLDDMRERIRRLKGRAKPLQPKARPRSGAP